MNNIHTLEDTRSGDVCLVKIKEPHYFVVEAKVGPNDWRPIEEIYPHIEVVSSHIKWDHAKFAKNKLKGLLLGPYKNETKKRPIRIRKICKAA